PPRAALLAALIVVACERADPCFPSSDHPPLRLTRAFERTRRSFARPLHLSAATSLREERVRADRVSNPKAAPRIQFASQELRQAAPAVYARGPSLGVDFG